MEHFGLVWFFLVHLCETDTFLGLFVNRLQHVIRVILLKE